MDVKLLELLKARQAIAALNQINFKAVHSFKIRNVVKAIDTELQSFDELLKEKQDELNKDGKPTEEAIQAFETEMNEAAENMVSLRDQKINLSWFAKSNGQIFEGTEWHEFSPQHFQALSWLIEDDIS